MNLFSSSPFTLSCQTKLNVSPTRLFALTWLLFISIFDSCRFVFLIAFHTFYPVLNQNKHIKLCAWCPIKYMLDHHIITFCIAWCLSQSHHNNYLLYLKNALKQIQTSQHLSSKKLLSLHSFPAAPHYPIIFYSKKTTLYIHYKMRGSTQKLNYHYSFVIIWPLPMGPFPISITFPTKKCFLCLLNGKYQCAQNFNRHINNRPLHREKIYCRAIFLCHVMSCRVTQSKQ